MSRLVTELHMAHIGLQDHDDPFSEIEKRNSRYVPGDYISDTSSTSSGDPFESPEAEMDEIELFGIKKEKQEERKKEREAQKETEDMDQDDEHNCCARCCCGCFGNILGILIGCGLWCYFKCSGHPQADKS